MDALSLGDAPNPLSHAAHKENSDTFSCCLVLSCAVDDDDDDDDDDGDVSDK